MLNKSILLLCSTLLLSCATNEISQLHTYAVQRLRCANTSSEYFNNSIVNGEVVSAGDPDSQLVSMLKIHKNGGEVICTASLIADNILITAAHCIYGVNAANINAEFFTSQGCAIGEKRKHLISVSQTALHPEFKGDPKTQNDIALIKLDEIAPQDQTRIPLITTDKLTSINDNLILLGYGITREDKKDSKVLRRISKSLSTDSKESEKAIYLNQANGSGGFCRGDSGSPVIATVYGDPYILAINSANIGIEKNRECQTLSMAIKAIYYENWISKTMYELNQTWYQRILNKLF